MEELLFGAAVDVSSVDFSQSFSRMNSQVMTMLLYMKYIYRFKVIPSVYIRQFRFLFTRNIESLNISIFY